MPITTLYEYPFTAERLEYWGFQHLAHHRDVIRVAFETDGTKLQELILDPFNPMDKGALQIWLNAHQQMHDETNAYLGLDGHAIWEVDWFEPDQMEPWLAIHAAEHLNWGKILNLG